MTDIPTPEAIRAAVRDGLRAELDAREACDREAAERKARHDAGLYVAFGCMWVGIIAGFAADWIVWEAPFFAAPSFPWWRLLGVYAVGVPVALLCARLCGVIGPEAEAAGGREGRDA